jgi:hypothetical protein
LQAVVKGVEVLAQSRAALGRAKNRRAVNNIRDGHLQAFLRVMAEGHEVNIDTLEKALAEGKL